MDNTTTKSAPSRKRGPNHYRVVVIEWLAYRTRIDAASEKEAETKGLALWNTSRAEHFSLDNGGIESVTAEED